MRVAACEPEFAPLEMMGAQTSPDHGLFDLVLENRSLLSLSASPPKTRPKAIRRASASCSKTRPPDTAHRAPPCRRPSEYPPSLALGHVENVVRRDDTEHVAIAIRDRQRCSIVLAEQLHRSSRSALRESRPAAIQHLGDRCVLIGQNQRAEPKFLKQSTLQRLRHTAPPASA